MIRVVIDTNQLPRNVSGSSAAFKRLVKLTQEGVLGVLMPHVIAEEWRTQQLEHLRKQFQKADEALKDVLGGGHLEGQGQLGALTAAAAAVEQSAADVHAVSQQALERLLQQLQTQVIPIANDHGPRVAAAYFKGSSPFTGVKSRKDFPDAFVYEAVADLAGPGPDDHLVVATADKNLSKHLSSLPGVTCIESLEQLVESEQVKVLAAEIDLEAKWQEEFQTTVAAVRDLGDEVLDDPDLTNSFIHTLAGHEVSHPSIPSDDNEARVSMVDGPEGMEVDWGEAEDYGPGMLRVPFSCTAGVLLDFYIYYADAYGQPDFISVQWEDPEERRFFDAQASAAAKVKGYLSFALINWPDSIDVNSVEVTVDGITDVDLQEDKHGGALSP